MRQHIIPPILLSVGERVMCMEEIRCLEFHTRYEINNAVFCIYSCTIKIPLNISRFWSVFPCAWISIKA